MAEEKNSSNFPDVDSTPVAEDIWCYSNKEKAFTWHVVVNHNAKGKVDRVECKVSKNIHKYKSTNKKKATPKRSIRKISNSAKAAEASAYSEQSWFAGIEEWGDKPVISFDPKKYLVEDDVIEHKVFGKGVVQKRRDNRVDVLFRTEIKVLPTARKPPEE